MNILFLTIEFAPVNTTGNFRSLKFVKYLQDFGINPVVVTLIPEEAAVIFHTTINNDLLKDIPEGTNIYRVKCGPVVRKYSNKISEFAHIYFNLVDDIAKAWKKNLMRELEAIMQKHQPEAIYTSLPPFSSGPLGCEVAKKYKIPLVVDMRDLWAYWGSNPNGSYIHFAIKKQMENKVFKCAEKIIGVTPQLIEIFKSSHPDIDANKFEYIPNGYDDDLRKREESLMPINDKFIIGYVGSFYYDPDSNENAILAWWKRKGHRKLQYFPVRENWLYRSPYFFFKALQQLFKLYPLLKKKIRFDFVGREPAWLPDMLKAFDLSEIYFYHGFRSHIETLEIQNSFDAFLATAEKVENGEHYCLPSKVFDYVQKQKPVLAFVTPGIQLDFLKNSGLAIYCNPDNSYEAANKMKDLLEKEGKVTLNINYLQQYHRKNTTAKLARLFKALKKGNDE